MESVEASAQVPPSLFERSVVQSSAAPEPALGPEPVQVSAPVVLWLLIAVGTAMRLYDLGKESLWVDEGFTKYLVTLDPVQYVDNVRHTIRNILPPLYFAVLHYWTALFGNSDVSLRLPSAAIGVAAIPLAYHAGSRMFDRRVGLFAAALLTFSWYHLHYSQEARMYELLSFLSVLSLYQLWRLFDRPTWPMAIGLAVSDALLAYTHHYGLFMVAAQWFYVAILIVARSVTKEAITRWLASTALFAALALPWMLFFVNQVRKVSDNPWMPVPNAMSLYKVLIEYAAAPMTLVIFVALLFLSGVENLALFPELWARRGLSKEARSYLLMVIAFAVPILLAFTYSVVRTPIFGTKYVIGSSVPFLILIAVGAAGIPWRIAGATVVTLAIALSLPNVYAYYHNVNKEQWGPATAYIEQKASPGDLVLFNAGFALPYGFDAYAHRTDLVKQPFPLSTIEVLRVPTAADLAALAAMPSKYPHVWLIRSHSMDVNDSMATTLDAATANSECKSFVQILVCEYNPKPPS